MTPYLQQALHEFHLGAKKASPVLYPALYVQAFLRRARRLGHSVSILFLDAQAAYYRVIRELSVGRVAHDDAVVRVFQFFDLTPEDMEDFKSLISVGGMMQDALVPTTLRHLAKDLLRKSWFIIRHGTDARVCQTSAGSRPGESWADVIFSFVLSKILLQIMEQATGEGLLTELSCDIAGGLYGQPTQGEPVLAKDCTWADDCAVPLSDPQPDVLVAKSSRLASIVLDYCMRQGMQPNLKPKKTAYIMGLRGRGVQQARRRHFGAGEKVLKLRDLDLQVTIASNYVHLGGLIEVDMRLVQEARRRLSMAKAAYDSGKSLLFGNVTIPLTVRASLFSTAVTSTFFNLALWIPAGKAWDILDGGFSRLLRGLMARTYKGELLYKVATPAVHILTQVAPLEFLARKSRLSLLCAMARTGPSTLWAVLQEEHEWLDVLQRDLQWLSQGSDKWPALHAASWPQWCQLLVDSPTSFKRQVAVATHKELEKWRQQDKITICLWAMARRASANSKMVALESTGWVCRKCNRRLKTKAALGAHFFKVHHRAAKYREVATGSFCRACGKEFWSRNKLVVHLRDSRTCACTLHLAGEKASERLPGLGSRAWRKRADDDFTLAASQQVAEPIAAAQGQFWDEVMQRAYADLCDSLMVTDLPDDHAGIVSVIQTVLSQYPLFGPEMQEIATHIGIEVRELRAADVADYWSDQCFEQLCESLDHFDTFSWPGDDAPQNSEPTIATLRQFRDTVDAIKWVDFCPSVPVDDVTPDVSLKLPNNWEAAWLSDSGLADVATVQSTYWLFVPQMLREAWDATLNGSAVQIDAPEAFWHHRLSLPFRHIREALASN